MSTNLDDGFPYLITVMGGSDSRPINYTISIDATHDIEPHDVDAMCDDLRRMLLDMRESKSA